MQWVVRSIVIGLGAIPPALWFMHVLQKDEVFQERAATPTYSPNFKVMFLGYVLMIVLAGFTLLRPGIRDDKRRLAGMGLAAFLVVSMFFAATGVPSDGYFMSMPVWLATFAMAAAACALLATDSVAVNLVVAWAVIGLVAPYFPSLFERKLTMGLSIPWAILAALGIAAIVLYKDRSKRNLITVLTILVLSGTSIRWFFREIDLINLNVSNTTLHSVYLSRDVQQIVAYLNKNSSSTNRTVVIAMPGVAQKDPELVDTFRAPIVPDINPVLSGLTGVYSFAGHWSETPDYINRRNDATRIFLEETLEAKRQEILDRVKPHYLVAPDPKAFPGIADLSGLGTVVAGSSQFVLIKLDM
ncbi:MAG: hypothetical protein H7Y17_17635 [Chlorobia bacterium]|nr:hypothetical protein [Fimbriimonadaceae bacterium]